MKKPAIPFFAGLLFAIGLTISGMTQPAKVIAFLDIFGNWDPSLAFVMGGAILIYFPLYHVSIRRRSPLLAESFLIPTRKDINTPLVLGSILFGIGWGIGGFCPGPAITSVGGLMPEALLFTGAMFVGFFLKRLLGDFIKTSS